jgi:hypothetical protein
MYTDSFLCEISRKVRAPNTVRRSGAPNTTMASFWNTVSHIFWQLEYRVVAEKKLSMVGIDSPEIQ